MIVQKLLVSSVENVYLECLFRKEFMQIILASLSPLHDDGINLPFKES